MYVSHIHTNTHTHTQEEVLQSEPRAREDKKWWKKSQNLKVSSRCKAQQSEQDADSMCSRSLLIHKDADSTLPSPTQGHLLRDAETQTRSLLMCSRSLLIYKDIYCAALRRRRLHTGASA